MEKRIIDVEIVSLGALGDGMGYDGGKPVYIPFTLEGDKVEAEVIQENSKFIRARLRRVITPGEGRVKPQCSHFAHCGGCQLQHLGEDEYYQFKRSLLETAVERAGFSSMLVEDPEQVGPYSRRRVRFKVKFARTGVKLGFYEFRSHRVVDIQECPVVARRISSLMYALRKTISRFKAPREVSEVQATLANGKISLCFYSNAKPDRSDRELLVKLMKDERLVSIDWEQKKGPFEICKSEDQYLLCGGTEVKIPQGAFIQATDRGQKAISDIINEETEDSTKVIDLYSGCGSFAFPLAEQGHIVKAVEGNSQMVRAIETAIEENFLGDRMEAETRDLFQEPVTGVELRGFDAIVINPPRNGAEPQMDAVGKSDVPTVIIVSCNPITLERDAKVLEAHGYQMKRAVPVDQFFWTTHLESVVVFYKEEEDTPF